MVPMIILFWIFLQTSRADEENYFTQNLDHFNITSTETFQQRYFLNTDFAEVTNNTFRIIFYLGNKFNEFSNYSIKDSFPYLLANFSKSYLYSIEHRYFGKSFPETEELSSSYFDYLTVEQSVEDLASFISTIKQNLCGLNYNDKNCSSIIIGGSYFGSLASWLRLSYPHFNTFVYSSSAPLLIPSSFSSFDSYLSNILQHHLLFNQTTCYDDIVSTFKTLEEQISEQLDYVRSKMSLSKSNSTTSIYKMTTDFMNFLLENHILTDFCTSLSQNKINAEKIETFYQYFNQMLEKKGIIGDDLDPLLLNLEEISPTDNKINDLSSLWLSCNQIGLFPSSSSQLFSSDLNDDYYDNVCSTVFGDSQPSFRNNLADFNLRYGGKNQHLTNILTSNNELDPYSQFSLSTTLFSHNIINFDFVNFSHCEDLINLSFVNSLDDNISHITNSTFSSNNTDIENQQELFKTLTSWMQNQCRSKCKYGRCIFTTCVCDSFYGGEYCEINQVKYLVYRLFSILLVLIPTIGIIFGGLSGWYFLRGPVDNAEYQNLMFGR